MFTYLKNLFSRSEWRFLLLCIVVFELLSILPLLYGLAVRPEGSVFTFTQFTAVNDWFVYYSYILQAKDGEFLFRNLFSPDGHVVFLSSFWLVVGWFARITSLSPEWSFVVFRLLLIPVAIIFLYRFVGIFYNSIRDKMLGLILLLFSSGAGFLLLDRIVRYPGNYENGVFNWPMDLWVPESITFLTLYTSPHFIVSLLLLLGIFWATISFMKTQKYVASIIAGCCALLLFSFHPFHVISVYSVLLCYGVVSWIRSKKFPVAYFSHGLIILFLSLPSIVYYLYLLRFDWVTQIRALQNLTFTTPVWITFFSYGILGIVALIALWKSLKRVLSVEHQFLFVWLVVHILIIYFPVDYQRRMTAGLHVVVVLSALYLLPELKKWYDSLRLYWKSVIVSIAIIMLTGATLFQIASQVYIYFDHRGIAYVDEDIVAAADFLHSLDQEIVVFNSSSSLINILPAYSGKTVYVGHGVETPFFQERQEEVAWFFSRNREVQRDLDFLHRNNITHLFWGPAEQSLGEYLPANKEYLELIYQSDEVFVYKVL